MTDPAASGGGFEIRSISADDAFPLRRRYLRPGLPPRASRYEGDGNPAAFHLGAFSVEGELVGVVSFLPDTGEADGDVYELQAMVILPTMRSAGLGTRLAQEGIARLIARGATRVWCDGRTAATTFYERMGFQPIGEEFITAATGPHYRFVMNLS